MLTAYIPLTRNRDISMRASLVLLLHRTLDRVLRRVLAREHPHGGGPAAGACLSGGGLSGGLSGGFPPAVSNLRNLVFNSAISLAVLPLVGLPLGGTSCRPRL